MKAAKSKDPVTPDDARLFINRVSQDTPQDTDIRHIMFKAHGTLLTISFSVLMPIATALMRGRVNSAVKKHYSVQAFAVSTALCAIAIGIFFSTWRLSFGAHGAHKMIGLFLLCTTFAQPLLGWAHHQRFKKLNDRTAVSYWHIYLGRVTIGVGWFNIAL
ncbi:hypothetical protein KEM55_001634 [Ascosphaera atra]|nr:hypothetical protein KEM55_001634 [Ascosphaera atra]